jgi:hypothetical protein
MCGRPSIVNHDACSRFISCSEAEPKSMSRVVLLSMGQTEVRAKCVEADVGVSSLQPLMSRRPAGLHGHCRCDADPREAEVTSDSWGCG